MRVIGAKGQATVEAAILLPVLLLTMLILCQPAILLYNRIVMENAASESCRLLATRADVGTYSADKYEGFVKRRLGSIPPLDIFHVHTGAKAWDIELSGGETSSEVSVRITNKVKPLPLIGWGAEFLGLLDAQGYFVQTVEVRMPTQPSWVWNSGSSPADWVRQWD
jgi:hypothetical protein